MNYIQESLQIPGYRDWIEVGRAYAACDLVLTRRFREAGLTLAQHDVLVTLLTSEEPLRAVDLARRLVVTKSNVTALLSRMERDGLVTSTSDPSDGRVKRIAVTTEGRRRAEQTLKSQREVAEGMISQLTPEECTALGDMMRRVRGHLESLETGRPSV
ncbi:MAG: MarR family transcriptional regulator [Bacteroidota bacterium]